MCLRLITLLVMLVGGLSGWSPAAEAMPGTRMTMSAAPAMGMADCDHAAGPASTGRPGRHALPPVVPLCCMAIPLSDRAVEWIVPVTPRVAGAAMLPVSLRLPLDRAPAPELPPPR